MNIEKIIVSPGIMDDIKVTADKMTLMAKANECLVKTTFNEATFCVSPGDKPQEVVKRWQKETKRRSEKYQDSTAGKREAKEYRKNLVEKQKKHDNLIIELDKIDFTNDLSVLKWICNFQNTIDYRGVKVNSLKILSIFKKHGYFPNENVEIDFQKNDRENYTRYIIGQALDGLKYDDLIHPFVHFFVDKWKKAFLADY